MSLVSGKPCHASDDDDCDTFRDDELRAQVANVERRVRAMNRIFGIAEDDGKNAASTKSKRNRIRTGLTGR